MQWVGAAFDSLGQTQKQSQEISCTWLPKPMAEGWNADTRMADAQLAVTRHLMFVSTFAPLHRPQADLHVCTEDST